MLELTWGLTQTSIIVYSTHHCRTCNRSFQMFYKRIDFGCRSATILSFRRLIGNCLPGFNRRPGSRIIKIIRQFSNLQIIVLFFVINTCVSLLVPKTALLATILNSTSILNSLILRHLIKLSTP